MLPGEQTAISVARLFADYDGTLDLAAQPAVDLTIQAGRVDTKMAKRDEHQPAVFTSDSAALHGRHAHRPRQLHAAGQQTPLELDATVREVDASWRLRPTHTDHRELGMTWSPLGMLHAPSKLIVRGHLVSP